MVIQCTYSFIEEQTINRIYILFQIYFLYHILLLFKLRFIELIIAQGICHINVPL